MGFLNIFDKKKRYKWGLILRSISLRNEVPITQVRSVSLGPFLLAAELVTYLADKVNVQVTTARRWR